MVRKTKSSPVSVVKTWNNNKANQNDFVYLLSLLTNDLNCSIIRTKRIEQALNNELKQGLKNDNAPACFNVVPSENSCIAAFILLVENAFTEFPFMLASKVLPALKV
jgi:hypothetical protein